MDNSFLEHYGIIGQKHGVRRFQYKDGSLTPAGKRRYGSDLNDDNIKKSEVTKIKNKYTKLKSSDKDKIKKYKQQIHDLKALNKKLEDTKKKEDNDNIKTEQKKTELLKEADPKKIYENSKLFTTKELNDINNKLQNKINSNQNEYEKQEMIKRANPEELYKNSSLFSTNELLSINDRLKNKYDLYTKVETLKDGSYNMVLNDKKKRNIVNSMDPKLVIKYAKYLNANELDEAYKKIKKVDEIKAIERSKSPSANAYNMLKSMVKTVPELVKQSANMYEDFIRIQRANAQRAATTAANSMKNGKKKNK